jgi:hypothetical protein
MKVDCAKRRVLCHDRKVAFQRQACDGLSVEPEHL